MKIHDFTLASNGLRVVYVEKKDSQVVAMSLLGKCGSIYEDIAGTAHFFEHLALDGSQKYPTKKDLLSLIVDTGGSVNAITSKDYTEFSIKLIKSEIEKGLDLLSQAVFYPTFDEKSIAKEKNIILQEYKRALTNNQRQLFEVMLGLSYKDDSMNRMVLGDETSLDLITSDVLKKFWDKYYHPNNFVLSICGDIDKDVLLKLIGKYFDKIPEGDPVSDIFFESFDELNINILKRKDVVQSRLMISHIAPSRDSKDYYATLLLTSILGKGMLSRLFQIAREEKQIVYDISSWSWTGTNKGLFYSHCGVDEKKVNEAIKTIFDEENKLVTDKVTNRELEIHKKRIRSSSLFELEDSVQLASHYAQLRMALNDNVTLEDEINKIEEVTAEQIKNTATKIFNNKPHIAILAKELNRDQIEVSAE